MRGLTDLLADPRLGRVLSGERPGLLLLDYDGTLAPFQDDREQSYPWPEVAEILRTLPLSGPGRFVIVSGRDMPSLTRLLGLDKLPEIWSCHGGQRYLPDRGLSSAPLAPALSTALDRAADLAGDFLPPEAIERKPFSVALHWRAQTPARQAELSAQAHALFAGPAAAPGLETLPFDNGLELRVSGIGKGGPVRALQAENPDATLVYLGDDLTDEDAFAAVAPAGLGVLVAAAPRPTRAGFRLRPPDELTAFLRFWSARCVTPRNEEEI